MPIWLYVVLLLVLVGAFILTWVMDNGDQIQWKRFVKSDRVRVERLAPDKFIGLCGTVTSVLNQRTYKIMLDGDDTESVFLADELVKSTLCRHN